MPAYTNPKRIFKCSDEFKMKAGQLNFDPQPSVKDVAAQGKITKVLALFPNSSISSQPSAQAITAQTVSSKI